ncbi:MAG: aldo/keto reductase [Bryobacterales bacterium]|nr:aldo/keto reductase [Bryobacterales bacterium]
MGCTRRTFLEGAAAASLAGSALAGSQSTGKGGMPTRILGRTGARVSILVMGGGSRFLAYKDEDQAQEALNKALDLGISYIDTAYSYGEGVSEKRVGLVMKTRRKGVFLTTKISQRNGDEAMRTFEGSLKRLQVDQVDLCHIHALMGKDDLERIEAGNGVLNTLLKLRDQKMARFIGVTCHNDPEVLKTALERHDFDCVQMALNAARVGMGKNIAGSFESIALPVAKAKKLGVIAMKVFAQDKLVGQAPADKLLQYSLSLPVAAAVVGMPKLEHIEANVRAAKAFKPMPRAEMEALSGRLAAANKMALDRYFAHHIDA